jgi:aqualysin 1
VVFKESVGNPAAAAQQAVSGRGAQVGFTYANILKGFSVSIPENAADAFVQAMSHNPNVDRVEADMPIRVSQTTQANATWGLDRSDQRDLPLSGSYSYAATGSGVRAYIVDSGILSAHADFGGRVSGGYTAVADGNGTSDCNGHGTHVAATVGGSTWGMAKGVSLVPVRVLGCDGSGLMSGVIAGLDWIAANGVRPAVVNMSLGGSASSTVDQAVANLVSKGITVTVAAGNEGRDACGYSPAREPSALTVGATASNDSQASYSNFGTCLDLYAPGSSIRSAWYTSSTATATVSGTSMAAPHVAGLAALLLQSSPGATPAQLAESIKASATTGKVTAAGSGSPNLLLFAGASTGTPTESTGANTAAVKISNLAGRAELVRNGWRALATITVTNASDAPVGGAVVKGDFSIGGSSLGCTTDTKGVCSIRSGTLGKSVTSTTFKVTGVTGTHLSYTAPEPAPNVTVLRP